MILNFYKKYQRIIFLFLTAIIGVILLLPYHDFQLHLAQGDHGRDLYSFKSTMDGAVPYRDYWWVYGPLMPYYYATVFHFLGISIKSVLIGYHIINFFAGLIFYLCLSTISGGLLALCAAIWFWVFNSPFEHTYNHIGGICAINAVLLMLFLYLKNQKEKYIYAGAGLLIILGLIKLNLGLSTFLAFGTSIFCIDIFYKNAFTPLKKRAYVILGFGVPIIIALLYWQFIHGLPIYVLRQCFPFLPSDHPHHSSIWNSAIIYFKGILYIFSTHWSHTALQGLLLLSIVRIVYLKSGKEKQNSKHPSLLLLLLILSFFFIFNLHEFLVSGVNYRSYWVKPIEILAIFIILATALRECRWRWVIPVCLILLVASFSRHSSRIQLLEKFRKPQFFLNHKRIQVYTLNSGNWTSTVKLTTNYLNTHLKSDETFLALIDDALYYYLTDKRSPTRQLAFCKHLNIHRQQEKDIIRTLENENIDIIILSNRQKSSDPSMGTFGKDYCPLLYLYMSRNFKAKSIVGDWFEEPRWFENHSIKIFRRNPIAIKNF